jgi:pimeloyl-ACP methyl ester carboxylesterase
MQSPYPFSAACQVFRWRGHQIGYYTAGSGPKVVLVHSINAAASSFEMRKVFDRLCEQYQVYAFDLLGFGASDRPAQRYSADEYAGLIADFTRTVVGTDVDVIASSLGAAFTVRAAARQPDIFRSLVLICPTGIVDLAQPSQPGAAYALLRSPLGDAAFAALASRASIRYFLTDQSYYHPESVDSELIEGFYRAAQQPGAKYAPICFLTGLLNCDISSDFGQLTQPISIIWGRNAGITPVKRAGAFLERNRNARLEVIEQAKLSIQDEHPEQFHRLVQEFWGSS